MPELPEVETVVRDLRPLLVGRTITGVRHSKQKLRRPWKPAWNAQAAGKRVEGVRRRGKWILIDLAARKPTPPGPPSLKGRGEKDEGTSESLHGPATLNSPLPFREGGPGGVGSSPLLRVHLGM